MIALLATSWWLARPRDFKSFDPGAYSLRRLTYDGGLAYQPAISSDGQFVVYASDRAGNGDLDIWLQQTAGGGAIQLTFDRVDEYEPSFSPDGSLVVYRASGGKDGIFIVPRLGGDPRFLAAHGQRPRFSPDGKHVAYWSGKAHVAGWINSRVLTVSIDGGDPTEIGHGRSPVWSPDGRQLLYLRSIDARPPRQWVISQFDGEEPVVSKALDVLRSRGLEADLKIIGSDSFVPDRWLDDGRVLFSARDQQAFNIWAVPISPATGRVAGPVQRITTGSGEHRVSSEGAGTLAFADLRENSDVWILPMDTDSGRAMGEVIRATSNAGSDYSPSLSVDGTMLAFLSTRSGATNVWMKDLASSDLKQLTDSDKAGGTVITSPDGRAVAYRITERSETRSTRYTYAVDVATRSTKMLCEACGTVSDWSQSGRWLIGYANSAATAKLGIARAVTITDLDAGQSRVLFRDNQPDWRFSWDEKWLAFHDSSRGGIGIRQVFVAPFVDPQEIDVSQLIPITDGSDSSGRAAWSPSGDLLYFGSDRDGYMCIYAQPLDPKTKRPDGGVHDVYHSHSARRSLGAMGSSAQIGLSVARNKIAFAMAEIISDIWIMEPRDRE